MMRQTIDLNCDLGEDASAAGMARDTAILDVVTSCNIACGGHAGTEATMRAMVRAACERDVSIAVHPSYPDPKNFGRRTVDMPAEELADTLAAQCARLLEIATEENATVVALKPHGALYNDALDDAMHANVICDTAAVLGLAVIVMPGSAMERAAKARAIAFVAEGFVDRRYDARNRLVSRTVEGAVIEAEDERVAQALALAGGTPVAVDTLCLHSDSDGALGSARAIRNALEAAGYGIASAPAPRP